MDLRLDIVMSMIQHNPVLTNLKPEALTSQLAINGTTDVITSNRRISLATEVSKIS
jgi:hypothetical protein